MHLTPSMQAAQTFLAARKACHELAITAESAIEQMPSVSHNDVVVLSALIDRFASATHADFSLVVSHLEEAMEALQEVRAHEASEIADWARERMVGDRREAA